MEYLTRAVSGRAMQRSICSCCIKTCIEAQNIECLPVVNGLHASGFSPVPVLKLNQRLVYLVCFVHLVRWHFNIYRPRIARPACHNSLFVQKAKSQWFSDFFVGLIVSRDDNIRYRVMVVV